MATPTLHYVHDPLCGWCYAVTPLIEAVEQAGMKVVLHGGGLWDPAISLVPDKAAYIRQNDARIAKLTGMAFGPAYLNGLLADPATVLWSRPTIAAVLAAGTLGKGGDLRMMRAIQRAHYIYGRRVVETPILTDAAASIGLAEGAFLHALRSAPVDEHIARTRRWMRQIGLGGFPNFVLDHDGRLARVEHEPFYGQPDAFLQAVNALAVAPVAA